MGQSQSILIKSMSMNPFWYFQRVILAIYCRLHCISNTISLINMNKMCEIQLTLGCLLKSAVDSNVTLKSN